MEKSKQTQNRSEEEMRKIHKIIIETAAVTLLVALVAGVIFWAWFKIQEGRNQVATLQNQIAEKEKTAPEKPGETPVGFGTFAAVTTDEYADWKTYRNAAVGYELHYPADWTADEKSGISEIFEEPVNYVVFRSPDKKYFLSFGLRPAGEKFHVSERTGMGVGESVTDGTIRILGNQVAVIRYVFDGRTEEIFYPSAWPEKLGDGKWEIAANFGASSSEADLFALPERSLTEKILKSASITEKTASGCASLLTDAELDEIKGWKEYKNEDQGYSFRYPQDWKVAEHGKNMVMLGDESGNTIFQWLSGPQTRIEIYETDTESVKNAEIACQKVQVDYLSKNNEHFLGDEKNDRIITAYFERAGVPNLIKFDYKYTMGASIASDFIEAFDLILKSIKFH